MMKTNQTRRIRCAVVTNVPAPYRLPMWDILAESGEVDLQVIYCAAAHIDPSQDGRSQRYPVHFLGGRYQAFDTRFTHADPGVWKVLSEIRPDVVITNGFIPTFVFAFAWAVAHRVPHVTMTDGTLESESTLTWKHRLIRRVVFAFTRSHLGACQGSVDLYRDYGIDPSRIHVSALCTKNTRRWPPGAVSSSSTRQAMPSSASRRANCSSAFFSAISSQARRCSRGWCTALIFTPVCSVSAAISALSTGTLTISTGGTGTPM